MHEAANDTAVKSDNVFRSRNFRYFLVCRLPQSDVRLAIFVRMW